LRARIKRRERIRRITILVVVMVIAVSLVVGVYLALNNGSPNEKYVGKPVDPAILGYMTGVSNSTLAAVGVPSGVISPASVSGSRLTLNGLPEILYIGGDYCPYCAVERWSLIIALSRFGQFSGLTYMLSSSTDINPNSPTFSFSSANYTSKHITFVGVEEWGRDPTIVVQPLTSTQQSLLTQYDTCGGSGSPGGIPFIDIANEYAVNCGAQSVLDISNKNWTEVATALNTPGSNVAQLIDGAANTLISAICKVTGQSTYPCNQSYAAVAFSNAGPGAQSALEAFVAIPPSRPVSVGMA
jgi:thiol-disulfide isomerase/thioredoxin